MESAAKNTNATREAAGHLILVEARAAAIDRLQKARKEKSVNTGAAEVTSASRAAALDSCARAAAVAIAQSLMTSKRRSESDCHEQARQEATVTKRAEDNEAAVEASKAAMSRIKYFKQSQAEATNPLPMRRQQLSQAHACWCQEFKKEAVKKEAVKQQRGSDIDIQAS